VGWSEAKRCDKMTRCDDAMMRRDESEVIERAGGWVGKVEQACEYVCV
jgi:hypothetical protein